MLYDRQNLPEITAKHDDFAAEGLVDAADVTQGSIYTA